MVKSNCSLLLFLPKARQIGMFFRYLLAPSHPKVTQICNGAAQYDWYFFVQTLKTCTKTRVSSDVVFKMPMVFFFLLLNEDKIPLEPSGM